MHVSTGGVRVRVRGQKPVASGSGVTYLERALTEETMTDQTQPWPVDQGSLAFALAAQTIRLLSQKGLLPADEIKALLTAVLDGAGSPAARAGGKEAFSRAFPEIPLD